MSIAPACIGGEFKTLPNTFDVINPYSQQLVSKCSLAGTNELEEAIAAAKRVEEEMAKMPSFQKQDILNGIANGLTCERETLARTICLEAGKPLKYALAEIERTIQTFRIAAEECKRLPGEYLQIDWTPAGQGKEGIVRYFPVGLVAGISPFNFPMNLVAHKVAPAIAAGCPIILKPARSTPLSAIALAQIICSTSLPKGAFSVLPMDRVAGNQLVTDPRFGLLSFTGSPSVGWQMKNEAGKKRVVLELGGNAGVIVTETANIDLAVNKCVAGAFAYSGQVCIHTQRIYVHESIHQVFVEKFINKTKVLKMGDPLEQDTDISVMIDQANAERVEQWINEAVEQGAQLLLGGTRSGTMVSPTVIGNTKRSMKVCSHEVFGPVVTIDQFKHIEEAITEVNSSEFGLQAGVFTNLLSEQNMAFNELKVGGVIINDVPTFRVDHMPYGGIKNSGFGREGVRYAILDMLEPKLMIRNMF
jgi:glyceraldehyde-3-phosphate dehydrogenase (NADP+)